MGYRNILINGRAWRFKIGRTNVDIRDPDGYGFKPLCAEVRGIRAADLIEGRREGTEDGIITPRHVRRYIERIRA